MHLKAAYPNLVKFSERSISELSGEKSEITLPSGGGIGSQSVVEYNFLKAQYAYL